MPDELPELVCADAAEWRRWLEENCASWRGVWLVLAKKGTVSPTSLTYDQALEEALCYGWVDGQLGRRDEATYRQRFTPRQRRSRWSKRNVELVGRLAAEGRMRAGGIEAVERAKTDGAWEQAYESSSRIEVPADLGAALAADPAARVAFEALSAANRYAVLYRIQAAKRADTRARLVEKFVAMLAAGETPHPQGQRPRTEGGER